MLPPLQNAQQIFHPRAVQLKQFALALPLAVLLICLGLGLGWLPSLIGLALAAIIAFIGWQMPIVIKPIFIALSVIALPIGWIVGELLLLSVYFGLVTPIGLIFRIIRRDPLERTINRSAQSYWRPKSGPQQPSSYLRRW
jgi:hypothetical protein